MRSYLVILLAVGMLACALSTGGCVLKTVHDKALAANRRCHDELGKSQEALRAVRGESTTLTAQLAAAKDDLARKQKDNEALDANNMALRDQLVRLQGMYDDLKDTPTIRLGPLPAQLDKALREFAGANPALVDYMPGYGMVKLKSDLTFARGSDDVQADAAAVLARLVQIINSPVAATFHVYVAGHTDDIPVRRPETLKTHPDNWYLSVHRAVAVEQILVKAGLDEKRIGVLGFGEHHPVADNAPNKGGNRLNRRVEIWIVPPERFLTKGAAAEPTK